MTVFPFLTKGREKKFHLPPKPPDLIWSPGPAADFGMQSVRAHTSLGAIRRTCPFIGAKWSLLLWAMQVATRKTLDHGSTEEKKKKARKTKKKKEKEKKSKEHHRHRSSDRPTRNPNPNHQKPPPAGPTRFQIVSCSSGSPKMVGTKMASSHFFFPRSPNPFFSVCYLLSFCLSRRTAFSLSRTKREAVRFRSQPTKV